MNLDYAGFSARQTTPTSGPTHTETDSGNGAVYRNGTKQHVALTSQEFGSRQSVAPAAGDNTRTLPLPERVVVSETAIITQRHLTSGLCSNDGIRSLKWTEADSSHGINKEYTDNAFQRMCTDDDSTRVLHLLAEMDEDKRHSWLSSPLDYSKKCDTPIIYAARHGCASVIFVLLNFGSDPFAENPYSEKKYHALIIAAQQNHVKVIEEMAKWDGFAPDKPIGNGITAMYIAIEMNSIDAVEALLKLRADPNNTIRCCVHRNQMRAVPGQNPVQHDGTILPTTLITPVYYAVAKGKVNILKMLLENAGSTRNPDPGNLIQDSPLGKALRIPTLPPEIVTLLLSFGADVHEKVAIYPDTCKDEKRLHYRPSLLEDVCHRSFRTEFLPCLEVLYGHFCATSHMHISYNDFVNFFCFMYMVEAIFSFQPDSKDSLGIYDDYRIKKNVATIEILLSSLRSEESQLSEEDKDVLFTLYECYRAILTSPLKTNRSTSESDQALLAWLVKVETMGINNVLLNSKLLGLLGQQVNNDVAVFNLPLPAMLKRLVQAFRYFI